MTGRENTDANWSEDKFEGEDSLRTVSCLRGRLLTERLASRNARADAEQLGNKMLELENQLKEEAKSRNRAEKKLKFLMKRLESMDISYVSYESEQSNLSDKSYSSVSSRASSRTKESENFENLVMDLSIMCGNQEFNENMKPTKESANSQENVSQLSLWGLSHDISTTRETSTSSFEVNLPRFKCQECEMGSSENPIYSDVDVEDCLSSAGEPHSIKIRQMDYNQFYNDPMMNEQRMESSKEEEEEGLDQDPDNDADNSMALVSVEMPKKKERIDPQVLDATVKQVLDSLSRAKEQLQSSMERKSKSMIGFG